MESNVKLPEIQDDQVLVRVMYAGVNPVETYIREGQYSRLPDLPYTPGSDAAGYIHQVGKDVTNLKVEAQPRKTSFIAFAAIIIVCSQVGERVFVSGSSNSGNSGSYAEFVVTDSTYVFPLNPRLSFAQVNWNLLFLILLFVTNLFRARLSVCPSSRLTKP